MHVMVKLGPMIPNGCVRRGYARVNRARGTDCALRVVRSGRFYPHPNRSEVQRRRVRRAGACEQCADERRSCHNPSWRAAIRWASQYRSAAVSVLVDPGFAAFVAQHSADPPTACGDLVDQDALMGGLRLEVFEQSVEERIEFLDANRAVEFGVHDVAREETVLERVETRNGLALG